LQQRLQHNFSEPALLQRALTHRSFSADNNERLEFLGDSVLSLAVSTLLYQRLQSLPEGDLSRVRANLVKEGTLHQIALKLELSGLLRLGASQPVRFFGDVIAQLFGNGLAFVACGQGALEHHKRTNGFAGGFIGTPHHSGFGPQLGTADQSRFNFHRAHAVA